MTRPGPYQRIYNLRIGEEATAWPESGEMIEKAFKRVKLRLAKYASEGRYFRAMIDGAGVRVQRTREGQNTKIGDWLMMNAGDRLLLKSKPSSADIKKAADQCNYITLIRASNKKAHLTSLERLRTPSGIWITLVDTQGRLVAECWRDEDGNALDHSLGAAAPLKLLWAGEWP